MSEVRQASNLKSLRFQRSKFFCTRIVEEIKKPRRVRSKLPIIMQRLKIHLCRKFGIHRVIEIIKNSLFRLVQHKKYTNVDLLQ